MTARAWFVVATAVSLALMCSTAFAAKAGSSNRYSISAGVFTLTDSTRRNEEGTGYGVLFEDQLTAQRRTSYSLSLGYIEHSKDYWASHNELYSIPVMLNVRFSNPGNVPNAYVGAGAGYEYSHSSASFGFPVAASFTDSMSRFCWQVFAGTEFGSDGRLFTEARYLNGGEELNTASCSPSAPRSSAREASYELRITSYQWPTPSAARNS